MPVTIQARCCARLCSTLSYNPNSSFESLNTGERATDSFTYTISDGNGGVNTATVNITINGVTDFETIPNGGFESGTFSNFRIIGDTSIETADFGTNPSQGNFQALLTTGVSDSSRPIKQSKLEKFLNLESGVLDNLGNGNATQGSTIKRRFTANAGDVLTFDVNFITSEGTPSTFNDFAFFTVNPFALELADSFSPTFEPTSASGFIDETGFETVSVAIPRAGTYTLGFGVVDVSDTMIDSGLLVDNIQLTPSVIGSGTPAAGTDSGIIMLGPKGLVGSSPLSSFTRNNSNGEVVFELGARG